MYLVTGAAGFIGFHTARRLLERGETVIGLDSLTAYYSVALKQARLAELRRLPGFTFHQVDLSDKEALRSALAGAKVRRVIHLAAQAGVRHSLTHPEDYMTSNVVGHLNMLEYCRHLDGFEGMAYASSSSVYGGNTKLPFSEADRVDQPVSLYAATKRSGELMSYSYSRLYRLPLTGLRFFSVYGPWGRPDMAMWLFAEAILEGRPIQVFNHGKMRRDFTYVDDIVSGLIAAADSPATDGYQPPHRLYNIGNNHAELLLRMIEIVEETLGRKAEKQLLPLQPGDVPEAYADIDAIRRDHGFAPTTPIEVGIPKFVEWYLSWRARAGADRP
jgi:UDP-glucuronate 4-epimerase